MNETTTICFQVKKNTNKNKKTVPKELHQKPLISTSPDSPGSQLLRETFPEDGSSEVKAVEEDVGSLRFFFFCF